MELERPFTTLTSRRHILSVRGMNWAAIADAGQITIPPQVTKYRLVEVLMTNASATPVLAQIALYTAAAAGGTNLVAAAIITTLSATTVIQSSTLVAGIATTILTANPLFVRCTVANAAALTGDTYIVIDDLT